MENINLDSQYLLYPYNGNIKIIEGKVTTVKNGLTFEKNGTIIGSHFKSTEGKTYVKIPNDPLVYACRHIWCYGRDIEKAINIIEEQRPKKDFFDELRDKYDVEDFTGHIGVILDKDFTNCPKDVDDLKPLLKEAWRFMNDLYETGTKYL